MTVLVPEAYDTRRTCSVGWAGPGLMVMATPAGCWGLESRSMVVQAFPFSDGSLDFVCLLEGGAIAGARRDEHAGFDSLQIASWDLSRPILRYSSDRQIRRLVPHVRLDRILLVTARLNERIVMYSGPPDGLYEDWQVVVLRASSLEELTVLDLEGAHPIQVTLSEGIVSVQVEDSGRYRIRKLDCER